MRTVLRPKPLVIVVFNSLETQGWLKMPSFSGMIEDCVHPVAPAGAVAAVIARPRSTKILSSTNW
jgi:hypothetical protein